MTEIQACGDEFSGDGIYIHGIEYSQTEGEVIASAAFIEAIGKGDEAMSLLNQEMQNLANRFGRVFVNELTSINEKATKLLDRSEGYERVGEGESLMWVRRFYPAKG